MNESTNRSPFFSLRCSSRADETFCHCLGSFNLLLLRLPIQLYHHRLFPVIRAFVAIDFSGFSIFWFPSLTVSS